MLAFITLMFLAVGSVAGVVEYWLWARDKFTAERLPDQDQPAGRRLTVITEALAGVGAIFVLAGSGVLISQNWLVATDWDRVWILAIVAAGFLAAGFGVRWLTLSVTQRLTELMWCASAACVAAATAIVSAGIYGQVAAGTIVTVGAVLTLYSMSLWLMCRREVLMALTFVGLTSTLCGSTLSVPGAAAVWIAVGLGVCLLGLSWMVLGWFYLEPLGTSIPAGAALALIGPAIAVHSTGWGYTIGIITAAVVMAAGVPLRNVVVVGFGSCALFGYITAVVVRYADKSVGVAGSLIIIGLAFIAVAVVTVRLGRASRGPADGIAGGGAHVAVTNGAGVQGAGQGEQEAVTSVDLPSPDDTQVLIG